MYLGALTFKTELLQLKIDGTKSLALNQLAEQLALSMIPRGSWGDVARRSMIRWAIRNVNTTELNEATQQLEIRSSRKQLNSWRCVAQYIATAQYQRPNIQLNPLVHFLMRAGATESVGVTRSVFGLLNSTLPVLVDQSNWLEKLATPKLRTAREKHSSTAHSNRTDHALSSLHLLNSYHRIWNHKQLSSFLITTNSYRLVEENSNKHNEAGQLRTVFSGQHMILDQHKAFSSAYDLPNSKRCKSSAYTAQLSIHRSTQVTQLHNSSCTQSKLLSVLGFDPMSLWGLVVFLVVLFSGNLGFTAGRGFNPAGGAPGGG
ncbi:hypothetical protein F511_34935 [Dorcoceras hygrometricum]|uniref:Uncharacterized protein n=1 Tax=Dorcoceras hygrometricum TaxID=472368 RepID=A0A2Z7ABT5_9LAMI|nr:hypothetical protein F511_34935 [Dorcoceras hygrometricum]